MIAFLTSNIGGQYKVNEKRVPCKLDERNGFTDRLADYWKDESRVLLICSAPSDFETNDSIQNIFRQSFPLSALSVSQMDVLDYRRKDITSDQIRNYDVIILAGGHVPTQNAYFGEIQLTEKLSHFQGILISISAGTMNCAGTVYAQPELEGEAIDPNYQRFLKGLEVTNLMILPHYHKIKNETVDGLRAIEDIAYKDSIGREFLCLCDGSYVLLDGTNTTLYGEAYLIADGKFSQVCKQDGHSVLH